MGGKQQEAKQEAKEAKQEEVQEITMEMEKKVVKGVPRRRRALDSQGISALVSDKIKIMLPPVLDGMKRTDFDGSLKDSEGEEKKVALSLYRAGTVIRLDIKIEQ